MKRFLPKFSLFIFLVLFQQNVFAQVSGDYRSRQSGIWSDFNTWERYSGTAWANATSVQVPGSIANTITIQSGHTVTIGASLSVGLNLIIESTAVLKSANSSPSTFFIRPGATGPATTAVITNNGTLGGPASNGDGFALEIPNNCAYLKLTGTGSTSITRMRMNSGNTNAATFEVDQNIDINFNGVGFTAFYNNASNATTDNYTITINAGKTLKFTNAAGGIHAGATITNPSGNYTYNVNGTIDLSATTTTTNITGSTTNASAVTTFNIGGAGSLITGTGFNAVSGGTALGKVVFNVASGGVIDATRATTLTLGVSPFILTGTASVKRTAIQNTSITFPISSSALINWEFSK